MGAPDFLEYSDPRQVALYDAFNGLGADGCFFCDEAERLSPALVIDLGCGTGLLTIELAKRGHNVVGIEPSGTMLAAARTKPMADKVRWIQGSYESLTGLKGDLLLMTGHVAQLFLDDEDWRSLLDAAHAALRPGGRLIFDSVNPLTRPWEKWSREASVTKVGDTQRWFRAVGVDGNSVQYEVHYTLASGEEFVSLNQLVYRSEDAIARSLERAGFSIENRYGGFGKTPLTPQCTEMVFDASRR